MTYKQHSEIAISLDALTDVLSSYDVAYMPRGGRNTIGWCALYLQENPPEVNGCEELLYISNSLDDLAFMDTDLKCAFLFVGEVAPELLQSIAEEDAQLHQFRDRIIMVNGTDGLMPHLLSDIQRFIFDVNLWDHDLRQLTDHDGTLQDIIDASEHILQNHIHVTDGLFNLLAYSKNHPPVGELNLGLVSQGFFREEETSNALKMGFFDEWMQQKGISLFDASYEVPCPFVTEVVRFNKEYFGHIVMLFSDTEFTLGKINLFERFCTYCQTIMKRQAKKQLNHRQYVSLLERLMKNPDLGQVYIDEQAKLTNLPTKATFCLVVVKPQQGEDAGLIPYLTAQLSDALPHAVVYDYEESIRILAVDAEMPNFTESIEAFCRKHDCIAYMSDRFDELRSVYFAARQTEFIETHKETIDLMLNHSCGKQVLEKSEKRSMADSSSGPASVYSFTDAFEIYSATENEDRSFWKFCIDWYEMRNIEMNSTGTSSDNITILYWYLFYERKPLAAAKRLYMHRNNVAYRIARIEKRFGLSLDSFAIRQRILKTIQVKYMNSPDYRIQFE